MQKYYFKCNNCGYEDLNKFFLCPKCNEGSGEKINSIKKVNKLKNSSTITLNNIKDFNSEETEYYTIGTKEIDNCLGGGLAKNSLSIVFGPPGVGKSTLLLQILNSLAVNYNCTYITAEETAGQINKRYHRLKLNNNFKLAHLSSINNIKNATKDSNIIIIDSINTIYDDTVDNVMGGITQIKNNVFSLLEYSKKENKTIILIGQVTKDGSISGPRVLEHMVDMVLYFDYFGDNSNFRMLKNIKNRFGDNNNVSVYKMKPDGLEVITDYSNIFLNKNNITAGTAFSVFIEGGKPIFVEIQSLIVPTNSEKNLIQIVGYDLKRLFQITAILSKFSKINLFNKNIFVNLVNGIKINEPIIDLGVYASILSSDKNIIIKDTLFLGEIGLNGNILKHMNEEFIVKECSKYFKNIISYSTGYKNISDLNNFFEKNK